MWGYQFNFEQINNLFSQFFRTIYYIRVYHVYEILAKVSSFVKISILKVQVIVSGNFVHLLLLRTKLVSFL